MDAELREQEDLIEKLEAEKRSAEGRTNSAIKLAEELRAQNSIMQAELDKNRQADRGRGRQADRQGDRQAERQEDRQADRQGGHRRSRQTDRVACLQADPEKSDRQTDSQSGWQADRQTDRQPGRQKGLEADRQADRQADSQTDQDNEEEGQLLQPRMPFHRLSTFAGEEVASCDENSKQLKLDLENEKASCEPQKAQVQDVVARKVSTLVDTLDDSGGGADTAPGSTENRQGA
eukprot:jgi/Undpi1/4423/HiC_scaffold_17.g07778.m1